MNEQSSPLQEKKVKVDGKDVSTQELNKIKENREVRLHQESDNSFRTLKKLNG